MTLVALLGAAPGNVGSQRELVASLHTIARALAPTATSVQVEAGHIAARAWLERMRDGPESPLDLLAVEELPANRFALVWQSFEAGAALLGHAVVALAEDPSLRAPGAMAEWLPRLAAARPPVHNTRRFPRQATQVGEHVLARGEAIVVGLRNHPFGHGPHACPAKTLALAVAATALETVLVAEPVEWPTTWTFLTLPNASIPIFKESPR